jgi:cytochrome c556
MKTHARVLAVGVVVLGLAGWLLTVPERGSAADEKEIREKLDKMAEAAEKDPASVRKQAEALAKDIEEVLDVMDFLGKRKKDGSGGWGVGAKPTGEKDDNIEIKIQNMGKGRPMTKEQLGGQEGKDLLQLAYRTAAMGEMALALTPKKKLPDKDPKDWKASSENMIKESYELAKAIKAKDGKAVKEVAARLNSSCTDCHGKFKP